MIQLLHGHCLEKLRLMPENSVDSIVTDPPYGISFMGKSWDYDVPSEDIWRECLRVLKPGGHLLSFCGTRTYHRMVVRIEDAGFEIRDCLAWLYGSGFPKSLAIDKQLKKLGHEKEADKWKGFGSALKPAHEPICLARKPISEKNIAENVLKWGVGGINVDGCRIDGAANARSGGDISNSVSAFESGERVRNNYSTHSQGRFPANLLLDEEAAAALDAQSGTLKTSSGPTKRAGLGFHGGTGGENEYARPANEGGASRFFYVAKVSAAERNAGLEGMPTKKVATSNGAKAALARGEDYLNNSSGFESIREVKNSHPTVKPIKLMEYLCKLITPPNGVVLDPFMGSGSTGIAAKRLFFKFIGMELQAEYFEIAKARIECES